MKRPFLASFVSLAVLSLAACDKSADPGKESATPPKAGAEPVSAAEPSPVAEVVEEIVKPAMATVSTEERSEALGFGAQLTAEADLFMAIYNGADLVRDLAEQDLWQFLRGLIQEAEGVDPQKEMAEGAAQAEALAGREMFLALGAGSTDQLARLSQLNEMASYHQILHGVRTFAQELIGEEMDESSLGALGSMAWMENLVADSETWLPLVEKFEMPPVLAGLRIEQAEAMGAAEQQLRQFLGLIAEGSEPVEFSKGGAKFQGNRYPGQRFADALASEADEMEAMLGKDTVARLLESVRQKQLIVAVGRLDDYVLLYLGGSEEACPVVEEAGDSLAAREDMDFIDPFVDKPIHGAVYGSKGLVDLSMSGSLQSLADGVRDGLQGVEGLGDIRDLAALLNMVGKREEAVLDLYRSDRVGAVISIDRGLRLDLFGGLQTGAMDLEVPHALGGLGESEDVLLFANWVSDPEFASRSLDLLELGVEIVYAAAEHVGQFGDRSKALAEFNTNLTLFNEMFRDKLLQLWRGLEAMEEGLGNEAALVVDIAGALPEMPMIPAVLVEKTRAPRIAYMAPVEDRAKLGESWQLIGKTLELSVAMANSMAGMEWPVPKPRVAGEGPMRHWHLGLLSGKEEAESHPAEPMVSVSDEWFVVSNSMTQAEALTGRVGAEPEARTGFWLRFDLKVLRRYLDETLEVLRAERSAWLPDAGDAAEFEAFADTFLKGLAASEELDSVTIHERIENGGRHATLHFHQTDEP